MTDFVVGPGPYRAGRVLGAHHRTRDDETTGSPQRTREMVHDRSYPAFLSD